MVKNTYLRQKQELQIAAQLRKKYLEEAKVVRTMVFWSPYSNEAEKVTPKVNAYIGSLAQLKCQSARSFSNCQFKSPSGETCSIGIGGGSSYEKKRIECLCTIEDYDPSKVCGITIKDLKNEDKGEWSCEMEFTKRSGEKVMKKSNTILNILLPESEVQVGVPGAYIYKEEMILKRNN